MAVSKHTMHLRKETSQRNRQFEEKDRNISLDETSYSGFPNSRLKFSRTSIIRKGLKTIPAQY